MEKSGQGFTVQRDALPTILSFTFEDCSPQNPYMQAPRRIIQVVAARICLIEPEDVGSDSGFVR